RKRFEKGQLKGLETARLIAALHDEIVLAAYSYTTRHIFKNPDPELSGRLSICAVGGYGRVEMAPQSDVDLLFLHDHQSPSAPLERITEYMLYLLWDVGFRLGQSVHSIKTCLGLARTDQTVLTSLLDLRFLCGDKDLAQTLYRRFRRSTSRKGRHYIAAKLDERDKRHEQVDNSRYVIEPNIKEGKGGLRDLHVLYWIARYLDRDGLINDAQKAQNYADVGLFDDNAAQRFVRATDFLWRARIHLHFEAGRPVETLTFDRQVTLARKMGYGSGPAEEAVEQFMREYFMNARQVGALTRIACARLEADKSLVLPKGLDVFLPNSRRYMKEEGFILHYGRLMFADPVHTGENPALIMQLFEIAGRRNLDIHPDAFSVIQHNQNLIDNAFRRDSEIADIFLSIFETARAPYATMKLMNDSGVLGRYLLEFGNIVARTQFNMHHAYTVDEHTLRLISNFHNILTGQLVREHPQLTDVAKSLTREQRRTLYLACLLHDVGKGKGDQCIEGAKLARRACRRLSLPHTETENVAWLVRRHLDMSEAAQRRDISNPETVREFSYLAGSVERLQMLTLLTVVDMRSVGPGVWNDWKRALLQNLYNSTLAYLEGHTDIKPDSLAAATRMQLFEGLPEECVARIKPVTDDLKASYWTSYDLVELARHARFYDMAIKSGTDRAVHTRFAQHRDIAEIWTLTRNRPGLFADIARAISVPGAQVTGAELHTGLNGRVMNVFYLQNAGHTAFGRLDEALLDMLRKRVEASITGDLNKMRVQDRQPTRRERAIPVASKVKLVPMESGQFIVETESRDRPGLLHDIACVLRDSGLDVLSAHIEVVGTRAIDAFYVQPVESGETFSSCRWANVKTALLDVLRANEADKVA
ncbi:MAG: [protein-PII] uridylyltransferase, partial [Hyphomonadaceae bacterium]|nr:[protein-PII] uridylyltransferase [Hyphomonadaceae bacterium]